MCTPGSHEAFVMSNRTAMGSVVGSPAAPSPGTGQQATTMRPDGVRPCARNSMPTWGSRRWASSEAQPAPLSSRWAIDCVRPARAPVVAAPVSGIKDIS